MGSCKLTLDDIVVNVGEVFISNLKLVCVGGDEIGGGEGRSKIGDEEGGESDVEGKDGLNAVSHVKGRVAGGLAGGNLVSPENVRCCSGPLRGIAITSL